MNRAQRIVFERTKHQKESDQCGIAYFLSEEYERKFRNFAMNGGCTKYNPAVHIPLLFKAFREFDCEARFCAEVLISKYTFNKWINNYPAFKEAYLIAKDLGKCLWERLPFSSQKIDATIWSKIYQTRFVNDNPVIRNFSKATKIKDQIELLMIALENGEISINQLGSIVDFLSKKEVMLNNSQDNVKQPGFKVEIVGAQSIS